MNAPPLPPGEGRLHERRCARHPGREAAARCPACGEFFCRECVIDHDGRLLCATCVARAAAGHERRRERLAAGRRLALTAAAVVALWGAFYGLGAVLRRIPPDFHDGTVWRKLVERTGP